MILEKRLGHITNIHALGGKLDKGCRLWSVTSWLLVAGGKLHPDSDDHARQLDLVINNITLRDTHAHLHLTAYTVPVVKTLFVGDGTSSEDSGTFLATERLRAVTAKECGMERNLKKTRSSGRTEIFDALVGLAEEVGLVDQYAEELRQHGPAANGGMLLRAPDGQCAVHSTVV